MPYHTSFRESCIIQSDTGKLEKRKSESSYQESNLRPYDYFSSDDH